MSFTELSSFLEAQHEPHILFDTEYRIIAVNQAFRKYCLPESSVIGRTCYKVSHNYSMPCDRSGETCPLAKSRQSGKPERVLHMHHTPNGEEYVSIELTPIKNEAGDISCFVEKIEPVKMAKGLIEKNSLKGQSHAFESMMHLAKTAASSDVPILLHGKSGTGKELVAQAIHQASRRAAKPFIVVDCSSISETLFESELFGHERGAFPGAIARKNGLLDAASEGTLFLDEVGEIPLFMQGKLLRLLETGAYRRVGSTDPRRANIRIISASSRHLQKMIQNGQFRTDLYYRINLFPIYIPTLHERREDIPILIDALLKRISSDKKLKLTDEAMYQLQTYTYPGNVRELRNILERASLLSETGKILPKHLLLPSVEEQKIEIFHHIQPFDVQLKQLLSTFRGNRKTLAKMLGISERTLYRRIQELHKTISE